MKARKPPSMPFYGKDAYDDEAFSLSSFGVQGLFLFLSWWQWREGSIPADEGSVLDKIPRKNVAEARRLWPSVVRFFPTFDDGSRRRNETLAEHRDKVFTAREKNKLGADLTNAKLAALRALEGALSDTDSDTHSVTQSGALRAVKANVVGSDSDSLLLEPDSSPRASGPDFSQLPALSHKLENCGLKVPPPDQIVLAWLSEYGLELINETIVDCELEYLGKHFKYLESILTSRRDNPNARPGNRRARGADRRPAPREAAADQKPGPTAADFGQRTAADVLASRRKV